MTASNDNRRVRKKRSRAKAPMVTMARVLADIYALPPKPMVDRQDESLAWLGEERHVPAADSSGHDALPVAETER